MEVNDALVRHVARLARLELTDAEVAAMAPQLSRILAHVEAVKDVDTSGRDAAAVDAVAQASLRDDRPVDGLSRGEALRNAPAHDEVFFLVPKVLED